MCCCSLTMGSSHLLTSPAHPYLGNSRVLKPWCTPLVAKNVSFPSFECLTSHWNVLPDKHISAHLSHWTEATPVSQPCGKSDLSSDLVSFGGLSNNRTIHCRWSHYILSYMAVFVCTFLWKALKTLKPGHLKFQHVVFSKNTYLPCLINGLLVVVKWSLHYVIYHLYRLFQISTRPHSSPEICCLYFCCWQNWTLFLLSIKQSSRCVCWHLKTHK